MTPNRLGLGLAVLTFGVLLLLRNVDVLPAGTGLMPLLLIAAGVLLLAGGRRRARGPVATAASLPLDGAADARLKLSHGAGTLRVAGGAEPGLVYQGTFAGGMREEVRRRGSRLDVRLRHAVDAPKVLGRTSPLDWDLRLAAGVPLDLEIRSGAARVRLDLRDLQVRSLKVETGASDTDIVLPAHGHCRVEIEAGAADVRVRVPDGVAATVRTSSALASVNVDPIRFPRADGVHRSPDYDTATDRADIDIEGALGSFSVR